MTTCTDVDAAIANLSAKVGGMSGTISSLNSKVSTLENKVRELENKSIDVSGIIQKAKDAAIAALPTAPIILGMVSTLSKVQGDLIKSLSMAGDLADVKQRVKAAQNILASTDFNGLKAGIEQAKATANAASSTASTAATTARAATTTATTAATTATTAATTASGAASMAGKLSGLLSLLPIVGTLLALAGSAYLLGQVEGMKLRIAVLESGYDQLSSSISSVFTGLGKLKALINLAESKAVEAYNYASQAFQRGGIAQGTADKALAEAEAAFSLASSVNTRIGNVEAIAHQGLSEAQSARTIASNAGTKADTAISQASSAKSQIQTLETKVEAASTKADTAISQSSSAKSQIQTLETKVETKTSRTEVNSIVESSTAKVKQEVKTEISQGDIRTKQETKAEIRPVITEIISQESRSIESQLADKTSQQVKISLTGINIDIQEHINNIAKTLQNEAIKTDNAIKLKQQEITQHFDTKVQEINQKLSFNQPQIEQTNTRLANVETKVKQQQQQLILLERPPQQQETVNQADVNQIKQQQQQIQTSITQLTTALPAMLVRPATVQSFTPAAAAQIQNAAAAGTCSTTRPGGCLDTRLNSMQNALQAGTAAGVGVVSAQVATLQGQVSGLASAIATNFAKTWTFLQLDRVLNILTFAATVHNAAMLSNDIVQTLVGALTNVLGFILPKDANGQAINVSGVINGTVENLVKTIIGTENYTNLTTGWAQANRIYQASMNVVNNVLNLSQVILMANEMIASHTGKIGNALKKGGVVLENAYGWMNPQPKFNRVTAGLETLQTGASTIQMVTQVPVDAVNAVTELNNSATELRKTWKEDDKPANKATEIPEPDTLKATETTAKTASQPIAFVFADMFDGEDL